MFDMSHLDRLGTLTKNAPEAMKAFWVFDKAAFAEGNVSLLNKQLIAVGVALTTQCPYASNSTPKPLGKPVPPTTSSPKPPLWQQQSEQAEP